MRLGRAILTLFAAGAAAAAVALYRPQWVEHAFPGFTQRTAAYRALAPGADAQAAKAEAGPPARQPPRPPVPVNIDTVQRGPMQLRVDAVGSAQPIANVAIKSRIDAEIQKIFISDGATVKAGDTLVKLDSRQIEAQIKQTEATIAKDQTAIDQAARDVLRYQDLFSKGSGTQINLDSAKTTLAAARATLAGDQALLDNQTVQLSWYTLKAPIDGHVSAFAAKAGNIIRSGDNTASGTLATIVQTKPIYVVFSAPQITLPDIRAALARGQGQVSATPQGGGASAQGRIAVLDNTIDTTTGTIAIRASFDNVDDALWPGQLCNVRLVLRTDPDIVSVPRSATQSGQNGNFVFVVEDGIAHVRPVKVGRFQDGRDVILEGLSGGETIVSDGGLLLVEGSRIEARVAAKSDKGAI